ncbi:MAG: threonine ammonia-lyase [Pirellulaceae bacterium]|nr:threonine ammonia-lyase [Pirellulaceae bacterium]
MNKTTTLPVTFDDIKAAQKRIADGILLSPCHQSIALSQLCESTIYCKLEYLQRTGSFKERGARNALLLLQERGNTKGVIAASAGNHALALTYHGTLLQIPVTVVMPGFAPLIKRMSCEKMGANVILHGETFAQAKRKADEIAAEQGLTYVHGYDDPAIIAGQGVTGLEILEQIDDLNAIVVPIGGAGLIAGLALAVKTLRPEIEIIGVEPENAPCYTKALEAGKPTFVESRPTLADGLAIAEVGHNAFEIGRRHIDRTVLVNEKEIALAIVRLMELEKSVVEGSGAAGLAAILGGKLPELKGKNVALVLCGGNIDLGILARLIDIGLVADGRLSKFTAVISDRPGGLAHLAKVIAENGASVKQISHDRAFSDANITKVKVLCTVETRDANHVQKLHENLIQNGIHILN